MVGGTAAVCDGRGVADPDRYEAILREYAEYLALERGRSAHTRRAYLTDLRSLFDFLDTRTPAAGLDGLSLPLLRAWLADQAAGGAARTTLARRTSAVKTFTDWALRRGLLAADPAARLQVPKARRTLPAVLRQDWDSGLFLEVHCDIHVCSCYLTLTCICHCVLAILLPYCARNLNPHAQELLQGI